MKKFMKKYGFITLMLLGIVAGCIVGAAWPGATALEPFGTLFINMMFCVVVPMVFCSIASAIANMSSAKRAGRIMGITVGTFLSTAAIAAILMYVIVRFIPVFTAAPSYEESGVGTVDIGTLIINFFTKPDFTELWSRRAILPLIVAAIIFGFGIQMCGGRESRVALLLNDLTDILLKVIKLISYYAPVGFFGFFASLVATHGSDFVSNYARAIGIYYVVSVIYLLISSPLYARFGGGKGAAKVMFRHLFRPAATAFGTCSSVATIPVNMEVSEDTGISKEVSDIVMPLGATMHMDGSAMGAIIKVAFLFGMFGKDFGTGEAILAIVVAGGLIQNLFLYRAESQVDPNEPYPVKGVDVSEHQKDIDWKGLASEDISFAFIKATEGSSYVDKRFEENWKHANRTDLKVGAYHFMSYDTPGKSQAENFIKQVHWRFGMMPPVVDVEFYGDYISSHPKKSQMYDVLDVILDEFEAKYGRRPIIYTNTYIYKNYISGRYDDYPIWISDPGLSEKLPDGREWTFCQYTFKAKSKYIADGKKYVDMNVFNGSRWEFRQYNGK